MDCSSLIVHIHSSRQLFLGPWTVSLFTVNLYDQHLWVDVPKKNLCHCLWLICLWPRPLLNIFHKNSLSFFSDSVSWLLFFEKTPSKILQHNCPLPTMVYKYHSWQRVPNNPILWRPNLYCIAILHFWLANVFRFWMWFIFSRNG